MSGEKKYIDLAAAKKMHCDICKETYVCYRNNIRGETTGACKELQAFDRVPAADVAEVKHGEWIDMGDFILCSLCGATWLKEFESYYGKATRLCVRTNYCPNCGAKMDGGDDNDGLKTLSEMQDGYSRI